MLWWRKRRGYVRASVRVAAIASLWFFVGGRREGLGARLTPIEPPRQPRGLLLLLLYTGITTVLASAHDHPD